MSKFRHKKDKKFAQDYAGSKWCSGIWINEI